MAAYEEHLYEKVTWEDCRKNKLISGIVLNSKAIQKIPTSDLNFILWIWGSTFKFGIFFFWSLNKQVHWIGLNSFNRYLKNSDMKLWGS